MCGRYTLAAPSDLISDFFEIEIAEELVPRYNIAPTQEAPVAFWPEVGSARVIEQLRWGLIPFWAKDRSIGDRMINARSETVAEKPAYRASFKRRRCLVVADGFYEWKPTGGPKQPYYFHLEAGGPFAIAGLWDSWDKDEDSGPTRTFTILTTGPNDVVKPVHHRMPVILEPEDFEVWLDPGNQDTTLLAAMLGPAEQVRLQAVPVSTYVNNPANQGSRCIEPIDVTPGEV